jgi:prepilin-type N-terminal cleavage/methylation domain-containing protein
MKSKAGFTLIEITVSLVLVGLIASIAGTSVIMGMRGYLFARENDVITQKAQLALSRLNREFIELSDIKAANGTCVVYESPYGRRAVASVDGTVRYFFDYGDTTCPTTGGDILVDGVKTFSVMYNPSSASPWSMGQDIRNLYAVYFRIDLSRPDIGGVVSFSNTVSPRNNNNAGGASVPTASNPPPEYSGKQCFVTTAAWGDADHPVVEVLRQFRDRILVHTAPGEALIRYYYEVGPSLASAIEDKPFACLIVRVLVLPMAGLAFLALSCPILIPLILFLSWGTARLILREIRRRSLSWAPRLQGQRGAMLVTLIATIVVFSALGAIMIGMFGTSALSQVSGNTSMRAYYLAESGLRYAASEYVNASGDTARETQMAAMHNQEYNLSGSDGKFRLTIYPYYYNVKRSPSGIYLDTSVSGGFSFNSSDYKNGSWVQLQRPDGTVSYEKIWGASLITDSTDGRTIVQFTRMVGSATANWDTGIPVGTKVTPACVPNRNAGLALSNEGELTFIRDSGAQIMPAQNGTFAVWIYGESNQRLLRYRQLDMANNKLKGIHDPEGVSLTGKTLVDPEAEPFKNYLASTKFVKVESLGTVGQGSSAVSRKVTYFAPIGSARATPIPKTEFKESFGDSGLPNWFTGDQASHAGTQATSSMYGGSALSVINLAATGPSYCLNTREFQIGLNWSAANIPLSTEWLRASRYLSYDVQVKVGQFNSFAFYQAFGPSFRIDEAGNTLGLSVGAIGPGLDSNSCEIDQIPEGIIAPGSGYVDRTPVITLWAKQYDKKDSAFVAIPNPGPPGCLSHPPGTTGHYTIVPTNLAAWETGNRVRLAPVGGGTLPGGLVENRDYFTRQITTLGVDYIYLFDSRSNALAKESGCWLWSGLQDMTNAGSGARTATNQNAQWTNLAYQTLTSGNRFLGLSGSPTIMQFVTTWSTFLVRIIEAPSVSVVSTAGSSGREIFSGDTVYTTSDNTQAGTLVAVAQVRRNPVYRSNSSSVRNWAGKTAEAVLILELIKDSGGTTRPHAFGQGKTLFVGEHPGGVNAGTVNIPAGSTDIVYRSRDNWIAVYVGDPSLVTRTPDTDPYDVNDANGLLRGPIIRTSVRWPVDDVENTTAGNDYFTIVRFANFVNTTLLCRVDGLDMSGTNCLGGFYSGTNDGSAPDILRFSSPDGTVFNSPSSGASLPASRAEVGLHSYAAPQIFYDDFALQFGPGYGITRQGFLLPLQQ